MVPPFAWSFRLVCLSLGVGFALAIVRDLMTGGRMLLGAGPGPTLLRLGMAGCVYAFFGVGLGFWPPRSEPPGRVAGPGGGRPDQS